MRLLLITPYFPPETGWGPSSFYELGSGLVRRGHEVVVLTGTPSYHVAGEYQRGEWAPAENGMKVVRVGTPALTSTSPWRRGAAQFGVAAKFCRQALRLGRFDATVLYSPPIVVPLVGALRRALRKTPSIVILQDLFPQNAVDLHLVRNRGAIAALRAVERLAYRTASFVTVHSPAHLPYVMARGVSKDRTCVLWNWANTELLRPMERDNEFRRSLGLNGKFVVSFGGILGFSQGTEVIVEASKRLEGFEEIVWIIVGDGVAREQLQRKAQDLKLRNVWFLPMQSKEAYARTLAASDVCLSTLSPDVHTPVVPSKIGTIMAAGRPLIAALNAESDGIALVKEADCGLVVPAGDAAALANAVLRLRSDPALRARFAENGRRYAERNLSIDRAAARIEEIACTLLH